MIDHNQLGGTEQVLPHIVENSALFDRVNMDHLEDNFVETFPSFHIAIIHTLVDRNQEDGIVSIPIWLRKSMKVAPICFREKEIAKMYFRTLSMELDIIF
jgi:hypothetical protein